MRNERMKIERKITSNENIYELQWVYFNNNDKKTVASQIQKKKIISFQYIEYLFFPVPFGLVQCHFN